MPKKATAEQASEAQSGRIRFPVIKSVKIEDYPLYPGPAKKGGLDHAFQPGINVIAGINGIGKTTLLNTLLRVLIGAYEPKKADRLQPGGRLHELRENRNLSYFAARIGADARGAVATLVVQFGKEEIEIRRNLGPSLKLVYLRHEDLIIEDLSESRYEALIREVSGISERYDFDFVVRNLLFFMEDKVPLIWNPKGQFEILRILFLSNELADQCAAKYDEVFTADSKYRNLLWPYNENVERLAQLLKEKGELPENVEDLPAYQAQLTGVEAEISMHSETLETLAQTADEAEAAAFALELRLHDELTEVSRAEQAYFRNAFPDIGEVSQLVLGNLLAGEACLACGNEPGPGKQRLIKLLKAHCCPICESKLSKDEHVVDPQTVAQTRAAQARARSSETRAQLHSQHAMARTAREEINESHRRLVEASRKKLELDRVILKLSLHADGDPPEIAALRTQVERSGKELQDIKNKLAVSRGQFERLLATARDRISTSADRIVEAFSRYASQFLIEDCQLKYEMSKRPIGVGGAHLNFPNFELQMSSATIPEGSIRHSMEEVSESQKEFVDLAFRMALLEVASKDTGRCMLVVETPEASLDSFFIDRAGTMLHDFTETKTQFGKNTVIATSNLNRENMVPSLLGLKRNSKGAVIYSAEAESRVLNLLKVAKPSTAYQRNKAKYDKAYRDALGVK